MTRLAAIGGAVIISFSAIFYALSGVDPVTGTFFRLAYAFPVLFVLWWFRRHDDHRPRRSRWMAFGAGLIVSLDLIAWQTSIDYIGTGLATLVANLQVVIVAVLAWLLLGEVPSKSLKIAIPILLFGVALVSGIGQAAAFGENPLLGTILAMVAAVFYAAFLLLFRQSNRVKAPAAGPLMEATAGAFVMTLIVGALGPGIDFSPTWPAHGWLLALALGGFLTGWLLITFALPRLPAAETSTFVLIQPALTMIWGAMIFGERPSGLQLAGALIVLMGVGLVAITQTRSRPVRSGEPVLES